MIVIKQRLKGSGNIALLVDNLMDLQSDGGTQCFPRYLYEPSRTDVQVPSTANDQGGLFDGEADVRSAFDTGKFQRRDAITDEGLAYFAKAYPDEKIDKDDLFYYVYGLLHSETYLNRYADNLVKDLPRIPAVTTANAFWAFSNSGRASAKLHVGYEETAPHAVSLVLSKPQDQLSPADYRVTQMKFAKGADGERHDKSTVIYNHNITIRDVPLEAYRYVVNGKPALEWVMERQAVTTHKESGIVNDANKWAIETIGNPAYPLELFQRVITVSLETMKIVDALPALDL